MEKGSVSPDAAAAGLRWGVERRLEYTESRLFWDGHVNRADIADRFGISINQASADLARYQAMAPENLVYDKSAKRYRATEQFRPRLFNPDAQTYLAQLRLVADRIVEPADTWLATLPAFDVAQTPWRAADAGVVRAVVRAIRDRRGLSVFYQSMARPEPDWRWMEPHALGFDGGRWYARAFCRGKRSFKDFVLARIGATGDTSPAEARPLDDRAWQTMIALDIAPHPGLSAGQRAAIARDYGMVGDRLALTVRVALLDYTLRRLGLDIDPDHRPPHVQHIILVNRDQVQARRESVRDPPPKAVLPAEGGAAGLA